MSPTNVKLADIFKGMHIPPELCEVCICSTDANSAERTMAITVMSDKLIDYQIIEEFKQQICDKYSLSKFVLRVRYQGLTLDNIDTNLYYSNLIFLAHL